MGRCEGHQCTDRRLGHYSLRAGRTRKAQGLWMCPTYHTAEPKLVRGTSPSLRLTGTLESHEGDLGDPHVLTAGF